MPTADTADIYLRSTRPYKPYWIFSFFFSATIQNTPLTSVSTDPTAQGCIPPTAIFFLVLAKSTERSQRRMSGVTIFGVLLCISNDFNDTTFDSIYGPTIPTSIMTFKKCVDDNDVLTSLCIPSRETGTFDTETKRDVSGTALGFLLFSKIKKSPSMNPGPGTKR